MADTIPFKLGDSVRVRDGVLIQNGAAGVIVEGSPDADFWGVRLDRCRDDVRWFPGTELSLLPPAEPAPPRDPVEDIFDEWIQVYYRTPDYYEQGVVFPFDAFRAGWDARGAVTDARVKAATDAYDAAWDQQHVEWEAIGSPLHDHATARRLREDLVRAVLEAVS